MAHCFKAIAYKAFRGLKRLLVKLEENNKQGHMRTCALTGVSNSAITLMPLSLANLITAATSFCE